MCSSSASHQILSFPPHVNRVLILQSNRLLTHKHETHVFVLKADPVTAVLLSSHLSGLCCVNDVTIGVQELQLIWAFSSNGAVLVNHNLKRQ